MTAARGRKPTTAQEASGAAPRLLHHVPHPPPLQRAGFTPRRGLRPRRRAHRGGSVEDVFRAATPRGDWRRSSDHGEIDDGGGRQGQGLQHPELNMRLFHKILEVSCRFLNCDCVASIHVYKLQLKKLELGHAAIPKIIEARMQFSVKCCQLTVCFILQF